MRTEQHDRLNRMYNDLCICFFWCVCRFRPSILILFVVSSPVKPRRRSTVYVSALHCLLFYSAVECYISTGPGNEHGFFCLSRTFPIRGTCWYIFPYFLFCSCLGLSLLPMVWKSNALTIRLTSIITWRVSRHSCKSVCHINQANSAVS